MVLIRKLGWALKGIRATFKSELSFRLEILGGLILLAVAIFAWPLRTAELFGMLISYTLVLVLEMMNTALEAALARLHPEKHDLIGKAKDAAAGAVFLSVSLTALISILILFDRLGWMLLY